MATPVDLDDTFTDEQLRRIDRHVRDLDLEIDAKCAEQREDAGHALARIAQAVYPGTIAATVFGVRDDGRFDNVLCDTGEKIARLAELPPEVAATLTATFRRLATGVTGVWNRDRQIVALDVTAALALSDRYPFLSLQDRLLAHLERMTSRTIRRIEITSELWDNGYFYSDTLEVDYSDGDSDQIYVEDMCDFAAELREQIGDPGPNTAVTIARTSTGITID